MEDGVDAEDDDIELVVYAGGTTMSGVVKIGEAVDKVPPVESTGIV